MARTLLDPVSGTTTAIDPTDEAGTAELTDGNSYEWAERRYLWVVNGDDSALTVTVQTPGTVGPQELAVADAEFTVPAGEARLLPRLGREFRRDYSGADASVTVAALDL